MILSDTNNLINGKVVKIYMMVNKEGHYYAINPQIDEEGCFGVNIFPRTKKRNRSGCFITERFLLNSMFKIKKSKGLKSYEIYKLAEWRDVNLVVEDLKQMKLQYERKGDFKRSKYIEIEVIPIVESYIRILKRSKLHPSVFFDKNFTIDTGAICNLGRALSEFDEITNMENNPLSPTHERNYGTKNSTMTLEGKVWRVSCEYNDSLVVQERNLAETGNLNNVELYRKKIKLDVKNEVHKKKEIQSLYLMPGLSRNNSYEDEQNIFFYKEHGPLGYLASYSKHGFHLDGEYWMTVEHYYQAQKFEDLGVKMKIKNAETPKIASEIGRDRNNKIRSDWDDIRTGIMKKAVLEKFRANKTIRQKLLSTGNKRIIENTTKEWYWGCGPDRTGLNVFGEVLMDVRKCLREEFING